MTNGAVIGVDFYLELGLIIIELIILACFAYIYIKRRNAILDSLIMSITFFLLASIIGLLMIFFHEILAFEFLEALLATGALAAVVVYLEMFENELSFTKRSTILIIFILVIGALNGARSLMGEAGDFLGFITPILFILVGAFYATTISKIKDRVRFENQKQKIRKVNTGVYLTFIFPKFISGTVFFLGVFSAVIFKGANVDFLFTTTMQNVFAVIVTTFQLIGLIIMSIPIVFSLSTFFIQSRKVSKLIMISNSGKQVFEFLFEEEKEQCDEVLLDEALTAVNSIMKEGTISCQELQGIVFGDLQLMTELREGFAVNLLVDRPTAFLKNSLKTFADAFQARFPKVTPLDYVRSQEIKLAAEKMIQESFGLALEEFQEIKRIVRAGYDKVAIAYSETRVGELEDLEEMKLLPEFTARLPKGARVLDAGCGAGVPITKFLSEIFEVIGIDISPKMIVLARERVPSAKFFRQDITQLTFPNEYFDGIISYHTIIHIPREEHKGIIENFHRMLKKRGLMLLNFSTKDDPGTVVDDFLGVRMYWSSYDTETNVAIIEDCGFEIIWSKTIFDGLSDKQQLFILAQKN